jgi:DNA-3-methyladenine glycosylase
VSSPNMDLAELLGRGAVAAAPRLLGMEILHETDDGVIGGRIVEVEAYTEQDPASHSFKIKKKPGGRNAAMFMEAGTVYVYFTYGMHYCMNIVCGVEGVGEAVLIRAIEPTEGVEQMWQNRYKQARPVGYVQKEFINLTSGPAKLVQALGVTKADNATSIFGEGRLLLRAGDPATNIVQTTRIGISEGKDMPWRWYDTDSPFVSKR